MVDLVLLNLFALNMRKWLTQRKIDCVSKVVWEILKCTCIVNESLNDNSNFEESTLLLKVRGSWIPLKMNLRVHHQVGQYQVGKNNYYLFLFVQHTLELHESIITELLNLTFVRPTTFYMTHEAQLLTSNGVNILVSNASTSSFQGIHSCKLGIQAPLEVYGEVCVINQSILSLRDLFSLFFVFLVGW